MADGSMRDGTIPFSAPAIDIACHTYYKVFGNLHGQGPNPVVVLHGGPGSGHEYCLPFSRLWSTYGIPVVFYDQVGCGSSTHLRHKIDDHSFWQPDLFVAELENLLEHLNLGNGESDGPAFDILGHSWGGVLATEFACRRPRGLRRLIIMGSPASGQLFVDGLPYLKKQLSQGAQDAIDEAVRQRDYTCSAYQAAMTEYLRTFLCRADPFPPEELAVNFKNQAEDRTVRQSMAGPYNPWIWEGVLGKYSAIPRLPRINVPTLLMSGEFDIARDDAIAPFFNLIPRVRWVTIAKGSHMPHLDSPEIRDKVLRFIVDFLAVKLESNA